MVRFAFAGSGPFYGAAREAQVKVKEMTLLPVDAYPLLDYRHVPQSNVGPHMLLTAFLSDRADAEEARFVRDMVVLGGRTLAVCEKADRQLLQTADYVIELASGLGEWARPVLCMPIVHYMAYYRVLALGLNPDELPHLSYWVDTSR